MAIAASETAYAMKSAASPVTSESAEMHSPLMSPTVARLSMIGIGSTSKSRSSASRSCGDEVAEAGDHRELAALEQLDRRRAGELGVGRA